MWIHWQWQVKKLGGSLLNKCAWCWLACVSLLGLVCSAFSLLPPVRLCLGGQEQRAQRPGCAEIPPFEHLPGFLWKAQALPVYNDSKHLKKAVYKHERMLRKETRKLGVREVILEKNAILLAAVVVWKRIGCLLDFWADGVWVYFGLVSDLIYSILTFRVS